MGHIFSVGAFRRRMRCRETGLFNLPNDVLRFIASEVVNESLGDLIRLKAVCKTLRDVVDDEGFYRCVDLYNMQKHWQNPQFAKYIHRLCITYDNPSAIFYIGAWTFFREGKMEEGLAGIRLAAEKGYDLTLYSYAIITRIMFHEEQFSGPLVDLHMAFVHAARRKLLQSHDFAWHNIVPILFTEKVEKIDGDGLYKCGCAVVIGAGTPVDDWFKPEPICDVCFWKM